MKMRRDRLALFLRVCALPFCGWSNAGIVVINPKTPDIVVKGKATCDEVALAEHIAIPYLSIKRKSQFSTEHLSQVFCRKLAAERFEDDALRLRGSQDNSLLGFRGNLHEMPVSSTNRQ